MPPAEAEPFEAETGTDKAIEGFIQTQWHIYEFGNRDLDVRLNANVFPSFSNWGRVRANANAQVNWEVADDFYWNVTATAEYDSDSDTAIGRTLETRQNTPVTRFDYSLTMGLKWAP